MLDFSMHRMNSEYIIKLIFRNALATFSQTWIHLCVETVDVYKNHWQLFSTSAVVMSMTDIRYKAHPADDIGSWATGWEYTNVRSSIIIHQWADKIQY